MNTETVHKKAMRQLFILLILLGCTLIASIYYGPTKIKQPNSKNIFNHNKG